MNVHQLIFDRGGIPRSGFRLAIFLMVWILFSGILGVIAIASLRTFYHDQPSRSCEFAVGSFASLVATLAASWLCGRWLEHIPFNSLGASFARGWLRNLGLGLAIGGLSLGLAVALAMIFGQLSFEINRGTEPIKLLSGLATSLFVLALAAAFEEAFFRGYAFQTLTRSNLAWLAIALTAVFFGAVHLGNPSSGPISTADTILAGILFGLAYLKTRDLWFPFGIHLMWNWMQGPVFGIEVSGLTELSSVSILREIDNGPNWLTGGSYGIEGGLASTIALVAAATFIYFAPIASDANMPSERFRLKTKVSGS
jgi:membrane protease YdiL (CAAX protease family)